MSSFRSPSLYSFVHTICSFLCTWAFTFPLGDKNQRHLPGLPGPAGESLSLARTPTSLSPLRGRPQVRARPDHSRVTSTREEHRRVRDPTHSVCLRPTLPRPVCGVKSVELNDRNFPSGWSVSDPGTKGVWSFYRCVHTSVVGTQVDSNGDPMDQQGISTLLSCAPT